MDETGKATHPAETLHLTNTQFWVWPFTFWLRKYSQTTSGITWYLDATSHPFLIWSGGISLTVLIRMSPFGRVPTHLPPQAASSPLLLLSALFMVLSVLSVMHLLSYPHRPGSAIRVSCSLSQWWIASCREGEWRAMVPSSDDYKSHMSFAKYVRFGNCIVSPWFSGQRFDLENDLNWL